MRKHKAFALSLSQQILNLVWAISLTHAATTSMPPSHHHCCRRSCWTSRLCPFVMPSQNRSLRRAFTSSLLFFRGSHEFLFLLLFFPFPLLLLLLLRAPNITSSTPNINIKIPTLLMFTSFSSFVRCFFFIYHSLFCFGWAPPSLSWLVWSRCIVVVVCL